MNIRMPRLLDQNLREVTRLNPLRASLQLRLTPLSTAELLLPWTASSVSMRDLVELYDEGGSTGIFRVSKITEDMGCTRLLHLEHSLCTLQDTMVGSFAYTGTVREALTQLLDYQVIPRWTVGEVELPQDMTIVFAIKYVDLLTAVKTLLGMLPEGYALETTQTASKWSIHLRALSDEDACEGRLNRNLHSIRYDLDSSRLCTCVYPFGAELDTGRVSLVPLEGVDHLQSGTDAPWGVVSRSFTSDLIFDVPTLREVALRYLERHTQPDATITVEGIDLCSITGEPLDSFRLGRMCRLCLPNHGLTLRQRICTIEKPDVYGMPGQVVLTLARYPEKISEADEIDELVRQVTASKLLGGTVTEVVDENRAYGTYASPIVHYFEVKDWAGVLDVRVSLDPDMGVRISELLIDGVPLPKNAWQGGSFSVMPYLTRDPLGQIAVGEHMLILHPTTGISGEECGVNSTVTLTVIEKKTTS